jgi:hypothetical protein
MTQTVNAQYHTNMWTRATITSGVTQKFRADAELQHRRQNGFDNHNMYRAPLMFSGRSWVHYQATDNLKLSVSPFAWFSNYRIIQHTADEHTQPGGEVRFTAATEGQYALAGSLYATGRAAAEYRIWQNSQTNVIRTRIRAGLKYEAGKRLSLVAYDELLNNVAGVPQNHVYDHNRIAAGAGLQMKKWLKAEAGYLYIDRLPLTHSSHVYEHNLYMNIVADIGKMVHTTHH